jgi:hypothetical protein
MYFFLDMFLNTDVVACAANRHAYCTAEVRRLEAAQRSSNPNTFLVQELRDAEDAAQRCQQQASHAESTMQRQACELHECREQLNAVQTDLRVCSLQLIKMVPRTQINL